MGKMNYDERLAHDRFMERVKKERRREWLQKQREMPSPDYDRGFNTGMCLGFLGGVVCSMAALWVVFHQVS